MNPESIPIRGQTESGLLVAGSGVLVPEHVAAAMREKAEAVATLARQMAEKAQRFPPPRRGGSTVSPTAADRRRVRHAMAKASRQRNRP